MLSRERQSKKSDKRFGLNDLVSYIYDILSYNWDDARSAILAHLNQMCWDVERRMRCKAPNPESNEADRLRATVSN